MSNLRPTLWRTCRAIANPIRLSMLREICKGTSMSVGELGRAVGISEQNASIQLRVLNSRGLITAHRQNIRVIYRAEANAEVEGADLLLAALLECFEKEVVLNDVIRAATAFTHERRIQLVRLLAIKPADLKGLETRSGICSQPLIRHMDKLEARRMVTIRCGIYRLGRPKNPLATCLLRLVCSSEKKNTFSVEKVISGGQTGVDRAALDVAIACGIPHGGFCPKGRRAEDGPISSRYYLQEMDTQDYPSRTMANVADADLTLIISRGPLAGGSLLTKKCAEALGKPCVHIDIEKGFHWLEKLPQMFPDIGNITLNVAGPRASADPEIYGDVRNWLEKWLPSVQSG